MCTAMASIVHVENGRGGDRETETERERERERERVDNGRYSSSAEHAAKPASDQNVANTLVCMVMIAWTV